MSITQSFERWCEEQDIETQYAEIKEASIYLHESAHFAKMHRITALEWLRTVVPKLKIGERLASEIAGTARLTHLILYVWR